MNATMLDLATFSARFRANSCTSLEYSVSNDIDTFGTMIRGDAELVEKLGGFVHGTAFAAPWYSVAARTFRRVAPIASLFRVDWCAGRAVAMTLYLKFPRAPTDAALAAILADAEPYCWDGPSPAAVAASVGLAGPTGIALRGTKLRTGHVAIYCLTEARDMLQPDRLAKLFRAADVPAGAGVRSDAAIVAHTCPLSVIGLDGGSAASRRALKLDWGEVPVRVGRALVASKGASPRALARFDELSNSLRARWLSYLGLKYDGAGFAGWRAYFSAEPQRYIAAGSPSFQTQSPYPSSRMPHY